MFLWDKGRQGSGYNKLLLLASKIPIPFDVYLIHYPPGSYIDWHTDPSVEGYEHHRLNIVLKKPSIGGHFMTKHDGLVLRWKKRIVKFRPDVTLHAVSECSEERYVLSVGWLRRQQ